MEEAIDHAVALLDPTVQRLPDELAELLETACAAWQSGDTEAAVEKLTAAVKQARALACL